MLFINVIITVLFATLSEQVAADDPSNKVVVAAQNVAFLAATARQCDSAMNLLGKDGLKSDPCLHFRKKFDLVMNEFMSTEDEFLRMAKAVDGSDERHANSKFIQLTNQAMADIELIFRTRRHIEYFLK